MARKHLVRSAEEKLTILKEAQEEGATVTARRHEVHPSIIYKWQAAYKAGGMSALQDKRTSGESARFKRLEKENERLKRLLAERELELDIKRELLKKVQQRLKSEEELSDDSSLWVE